jgi:hypothetical protein
VAHNNLLKAMKLFRFSNMLLTIAIQEKAKTCCKHFFPELLYLNCLVVTTMIKTIQFSFSTVSFLTVRQQEKFRKNLKEDATTFCTILFHLRNEIIEIEQTNDFMFVDHLLAAAGAA